MDISRPCGRDSERAWSTLRAVRQGHLRVLLVLHVVTHLGVTSQIVHEQELVSLYGSLPPLKRCVRFKTQIESHGCVYMSTAVSPRHYTRSQDCEAMVRRSNREGQGQGFWWLFLAGLTASCRWAQLLASDVMSIVHAVPGHQDQTCGMSCTMIR